MLLGKILFDWKCVCLCVHTSAYFCRYGQLERSPTRLYDLSEIWGPLLIFTSPLFSPYSLFLCLSWHRPSGCRAKWSVSEEGHPLGIVFGTNTAAAFPLLYPSVGFGPLLWTTAQIWPGFSKHACTAARPLYTGLFCKYCRQQLNVGMEPEFGALDSGIVYAFAEAFISQWYIMNPTGNQFTNWRAIVSATD